MDENLIGFSKPGFGWTQEDKNVVIISGHKLIDENISSSKVIDFVNSNCHKNLISETFWEKFSLAFHNYFRDESIEFMTELKLYGTSNGRDMKWELMIIPPNKAFKLHAHPNIEVIYVVTGAIHEYRYEVTLLFILFYIYIF
jgi:hypothetical protein